MALNRIYINFNLMAKIIKAHGEVLEIEPRNGSDFQLEEMQAIVSGYIEIVYLKDGRLMVINEEGKLNNLAINWEATKLYDNPYDVIVGDVLVCSDNEIK